MNCPLCSEDGGELLYRDDALRVVFADEPGYPGFTRVIWQAHVAEMTDLSGSEQAHLMNAVFQVESLMRQTMKPDKINLASLGNQVPHLHWHVIPRYADDPTFPAPVWAPAVRSADGQQQVNGLAAFKTRLRQLAVSADGTLGSR